MLNRIETGRRGWTLLLCMAGIALAGMLWMPSTAAAIPMDYVVKHGGLSIEIPRSHGRSDRTINVHVRGGTFTYDDETGLLSNLVVKYRGRAYALGGPIDIAAAGSIRMGRRNSVAVRVSGLDVPIQITRNFSVTATGARLWGRFTRVSPATAVPEPGAAFLFGSGIVAVATASRRSRIRTSD